MRRVFYVDESGSGKGPCNCLVIGGVVLYVSGSYMYGGVELLESIKMRLNIRGELKWRLLKRLGVGDAVFKEIAGRYPINFVQIHVGEDDIEGAFLALMRNMEADLYVVDKGLIDAGKFSKVVERPSTRSLVNLSDALEGLGMPIYAIGGNHDYHHLRPDETPLRVLDKLRIIKLLCFDGVDAGGATIVF